MPVAYKGWTSARTALLGEMIYREKEEYRMKVRIVVDSTADVTPDIREQLTVVPLSVSFGQETYIDGVTINHSEFYQKMAQSKDLPTTSQPSPDAFARVFEAAKNAGEELVVLCVSSGLSGTCQSAMIAAQDYPENVYVVDTMHVANGLGVLAEYALELAAQGKSAKEIAQAVEAERENVQFLAMVDTLTNLQKGGRIPKSLAIAGTLLSLKPVLTIKNGVLENVAKARGTKQGYTLLNKEVEAAGIDFDKPFLLAYTGVTDESMQKYLAAAGEIWNEGGKPVRQVPLCSVVGTHAGAGAVVVACFKKH